MANAPSAIDLFSGVGGLSLACARTGFALKAAVEIEQRILDSHTFNFPSSAHLLSDVSELSGNELKRKAGIGGGELGALVGGPPCQGFSTMGKRNTRDKRNKLFIHFFRLVAETKPVFFIAENVPGILTKQYSPLVKAARRIVSKEYDLLDAVSVDASQFGAATTRTRVFFIGVRKGVEGSEKIPDAIEAKKKPDSVYVKDALNGLPFNIPDTWNDYESSWQNISTERLNAYLSRLNELTEGVGDAVAIERYMNKQEVSGCFWTGHSDNVRERFAKLQPGETDCVSRGKKLDMEGFCPTLRAGTDSTRGSFQAVRPIHPIESRVITPREAARLQGFPDWFQFHKTKWHSFRQIGNSVCPIAAEKIVTAVKESLNM